MTTREQMLFDFNELCQLYPELHNAKLRFSSRMTRTIGKCRCIQHRLTGHVRLRDITIATKYMVINSRENMRHILLHEIAHAITHLRHQANCYHDYRFKQVCDELGIPLEYQGTCVPKTFNTNISR